MLFDENNITLAAVKLADDIPDANGDGVVNFHDILIVLCAIILCVVLQV